MRRYIFGLALLSSLTLGAQNAHAASIAIFGDNRTDEFLAANGHTVTLVSDGQLATPGFLNAFDVFYFTRDGASFGAGLSAGAAANVIAWATGNAVGLNCDCADSLPDSGDFPDSGIQALTLNAVAYAAASGHGFVGEFNGLVSAMAANSDGFTPLGLFAGFAGNLTGGGVFSGVIFADAVNGGHSVLAGVGLPFDPGGVEYGAPLGGYNPAQVIARWGNGVEGTPAVLVQGAVPVPEPTTMALLGSGILGLYARRRRK